MFWLVRVPACICLLIGPVLLGYGGWRYHGFQSVEAEKAVIRAATPPKLVAIERFDPARDAGAGGEMSILGQVDFAQAQEVFPGEGSRSLGDSRSDGSWIVAPIYPATASRAEGAALGVMIERGPATPDQIRHMVTREGPFAPVLAIRGAKVDATAVETATPGMSSFRLAPNPLYIDPYEAGRNKALAASAHADYDAIELMIFGLAMGLYGVVVPILARPRRARKAHD